jgi:single-strand DNA-binding protein
MTGLPEITVIGTLTADPDLRYTPNGVAVANLTVAANDRRYNRDTQQWDDKGATFLRCTLWRKPAENALESLSKGDRVIVLGTLRQREWTTDDGQKRYAFEVDVTEIGPSLKWATAKVNKATRTSGQDDPWSVEPAGPGEFRNDPPPF